MKKNLRRSAWILIPLLVFIFLVVRATPAQWGIALAGLPVQTEGISGTIWQGRVANVVIPYHGGHYALGRLEWEMSPWSLLRLSPCVRFRTELEYQMSDGTACSTVGGRLTLKDTRLSVPAAIAELWAPVRLRGQLDAHIASATIVNDQVRELLGSGSWTNAEFHNSQIWIGLGTIAFDLSENGQGGIAAQIFDIDGPLDLDLNSSFDPAGSYLVRGTIALRPQAPVEIGQLLRIVAEEEQAGRFRIEWAGS